MEYEISCVKCRSPIVQVIEKVNRQQAIIETICTNKKCKYITSLIVPIAIFHKNLFLIRRYGMVVMA